MNVKVNHLALIQLQILVHVSQKVHSDCKVVLLRLNQDFTVRVTGEIKFSVATQLPGPPQQRFVVGCQMFIDVDLVLGERGRDLGSQQVLLGSQS